MTAFRDLVGSVREQWNTAIAEAQAQAQAERQAPIRPTSIHAAGSTGASDVERARMRQDRARDPKPGWPTATCTRNVRW